MNFFFLPFHALGFFFSGQVHVCKIFFSPYNMLQDYFFSVCSVGKAAFPLLKLKIFQHG